MCDISGVFCPVKNPYPFLGATGESGIIPCCFMDWSGVWTRDEKQRVWIMQSSKAVFGRAYYLESFCSGGRKTHCSFRHVVRLIHTKQLLSWINSLLFLISIGWCFPDHLSNKTCSAFTKLPGVPECAHFEVRKKIDHAEKYMEIDSELQQTTMWHLGCVFGKGTV